MDQGIPDIIGSASIIHRTYKFYLFLYGCIELFPKKDRYAIGLKCENLTLELLEILFSANSKQKQCRMRELEKADLKLKILKTCVRLVFDAKIVDSKKYLALESPLQEIGKMLGGWIKATKNESD